MVGSVNTSLSDRKRYVKQLIGNVSVTIKNVKVEGKNSVVFDYEVKGVSASSEDKPYLFKNVLV